MLLPIINNKNKWVFKIAKTLEQQINRAYKLYETGRIDHNEFMEIYTKLQSEIVKLIVMHRNGEITEQELNERVGK